MKWQNNVAIASLLLNIILTIFVVNSAVSAADTTITVPVLPKGTGYEVVVPNKKLDCVDIEVKLGLKRGDVEEYITDPEKGTIIKFKKDIPLTSTQVQMATDTVKGLIPSIEAK